MKAITRFSNCQLKGIIAMIKDQKTPLTDFENKLIEEIKKEKPELWYDVVIATNGKSNISTQLLITDDGKKVRLENMDKFGDDYRNRWISLQSNGKGQFFISSYLGFGRWFL